MKINKIALAMHGPISESIKARLNEIDSRMRKNALTYILKSLEFKSDVIAAGGEIYAVGGIVRDALMGKASDDLDIVIRGIPYEKLFKILSKYGKATDTSVTDENGKKDFGATKFVSRNPKFNEMLAKNGIRKDIDVMLPRKDSKIEGEKGHRSIKSDVNYNYTIYDDLLRRDITINAIALDLSGKIIDNGSSLSDIKNGIIRAVSEDAFVEDPLRMIRAVRFAARFNYQWDNRTLDLIRKNAHLLADKKELPKERFMMEFEKMIGKSDMGRAVKLLVELGLYKSMFGVEPRFNDYSKFDHAKNVADFSYMLFEGQPLDKIINLVFNNITNSNEVLNYIKAIVLYFDSVVDKNLSGAERVTKLASVYNTSTEMLLTSFFVKNEDKEVAEKFMSKELPASNNDIDFKGDDFKNFVLDLMSKNNAGQNLAMLGKAKSFAVRAIYEGLIKNQKEEIKNFIQNNLDWLK